MKRPSVAPKPMMQSLDPGQRKAVALEPLGTNMNVEPCRTFLGSKLGWVFTLSLAVLGAYLLWNHTGHVIYALPFVFLLACPLMHVFGHHHGHNHKQENLK